MLLLTQAQLVSENMDNYINFLVNKKVQEDPSQLVRWKIIQGITNMMDQNVESVIPHLQKILEFMSNALKENDQKVALAATEFWSGILHVVASDIKYSEFVAEKIWKLLPDLCPLLLDCCKFTEFDRLIMQSNNQGDEEDSENLSSLTTLRRSAAFTVGRFSKIYHNDIFYIL